MSKKYASLQPQKCGALLPAFAGAFDCESQGRLAKGRSAERYALCAAWGWVSASQLLLLEANGPVLAACVSAAETSDLLFLLDQKTRESDSVQFQRFPTFHRAVAGATARLAAEAVAIDDAFRCRPLQSLHHFLVDCNNYL